MSKLVQTEWTRFQTESVTTHQNDAQSP